MQRISPSEMQGSFLPESAEKFLQLMAAEGYETRETDFGKGLQNFSTGLNNRVDAWEAAAEDFSGNRGEYIDNYNFTRCERPDGSAYGTSGKCRKGKEVAKKEEKKFTHEVHADLQRGFSKKAFKDYVGKWGGKIEGETDRGVYVRFPSESYARSFARNLKFDTRIKGVDVSEHDINTIEGLQNFSTGLNNRVDAWGAAAENFSENRGEYIDNYNFTRCERPDGSAYGTSGKCRKGTETSKEKEPESTVRKQKYSWGTLMKVSKGSEYGTTLHPEQQERLRGLRDGESTKFEDESGKKWGAVRDGDFIHLMSGDRSYGDRTQKLSFRRSNLRDGEGRIRLDEQSAIDQLSQLLPKGENIMDSLGNITISTGRGAR